LYHVSIACDLSGALISGSLGTLVVIGILAICIGLALRSVIKKHQSGGCGCGCEHCHGACHTGKKH